jgi:hypothetical protein
MSTVYDYSGTLISKSSPNVGLTTVKRTVYLDSGDRDFTYYPTNGSYTLFLPRMYERVVSISVKSAEFPLIGYAHMSGSTGATGCYEGTPLYFLMEIDGLNRSDETVFGGNRSAMTDSVFAKFQVLSQTDNIFYNESSGQKNMEYYRPAISKLDRLHVRTRLHTQMGSSTDPMHTDGYIYWRGQEFSLTLEVETMENSFDDFSTMESRIGDRAGSGFYGV